MTIVNKKREPPVRVLMLKYTSPCELCIGFSHRAKIESSACATRLRCIILSAIRAGPRKVQHLKGYFDALVQVKEFFLQVSDIRFQNKQGFIARLVKLREILPSTRFTRECCKNAESRFIFTFAKTKLCQIATLIFNKKVQEESSSMKISYCTLN